MSGALSANKLAGELQDALNESLALDQLSLSEVTDAGDTSEYSLINPPSIGSSTGRTTLSSMQSPLVTRSGGVINSPQPNMGGPGVGGAPGWVSSLHRPPNVRGGLVYLPYQKGESGQE